MTLLPGAFTVSLHAKIVLRDASVPLARTAADQLQQTFRACCGAWLEVLAGAPRAGDIALDVDPALAPQAYALRITGSAVTITGGDQAGLLHGAQALRQVIRQCGWTLPCLEVDDAPLYPERGFYHDVTRGRTPTLQFLKDLADQACLYRLNQLQLYVEHTYLFRDLSEMWLAGEPLTAQEILELDEYCALRGIELVPSMSSFGHLFELLRTRSCAHLCEFDNAADIPSTMPNRMAHSTINVSDPASLALVTAMMDEYMPLFRSRRFNLCADETFDLGKGRNADRLAQEGERALYMGFVRALCAHVVAAGRTPMFWGDIVLRFPDALAELPEGTICLNWNYSPNARENGTRALHEAGAVQYVCPGVIGWNRLVPRLPDSYDNIRKMAACGRRYGAIGLLNTDWGDYGHVNDPRFSLPGMILGAHFAWSDAELPLDTLLEAMSRVAYGDRTGTFLTHVAAMQDCDVYSWYDLVQYMEWQRGTETHDSTPLQRSTVRYADITAADEALDRICEGLRACAMHMDDQGRPAVQRYLVAAEGLSAWNHAAEALARNRTDAQAAARLENWYRLYERMWREVSLESELWRIRDMVRFYGRALRG